MELKNKACDALLAHRVDSKLKGSKINSVINRIHVAQPVPRDDIVRAPFIPDSVKERKKYDKNDPNRRILLHDIEQEEERDGIFSINLKSTSSTFVVFTTDHLNGLSILSANYLLANDEWKFDTMPEIMDGKNVADFIDPDIAEKLEALEREEEKLQAEGFYESEEDMVYTHTHPPYCILT